VISIGVPFGIKIESALIVRIFPRATPSLQSEQLQSEIIIDSASSSSAILEGLISFTSPCLGTASCILCFTKSIVFHGLHA